MADDIEIEFEEISATEPDGISQERWHQNPEQHLNGIAAWPPPDTNTFDLAEPGMFSSEDKTVLNWAGENYYLSCDAPVSHLPNGGMSHCTKRINHPGDIHEDFDGRTKDEWELNLGVLSLEEAVGVAVGAATTCWENLSGAGVFQSERASAIAQQLHERIKQAGVDIYD